MPLQPKQPRKLTDQRQALLFTQVTLISQLNLCIDLRIVIPGCPLAQLVEQMLCSHCGGTGFESDLRPFAAKKAKKKILGTKKKNCVSSQKHTVETGEMRWETAVG